MASTLTQAPPIPQPESNAMSWDLPVSGVNADGVAPFDMEAAPMGPGISVGQDQTLNCLTHDHNFTPAQAAFPQLTDLANDYGMNDDWYSLIGTALYNGAAQGPSYDPLSSAQAQTPVMSPVSDKSMRDAYNSDSSLFSPHMDVSGGSSDIHEESYSATSAFLDN